jgi:hypothetical protein
MFLASRNKGLVNGSYTKQTTLQSKQTTLSLCTHVVVRPRHDYLDARSLVGSDFALRCLPQSLHIALFGFAFFVRFVYLLSLKACLNRARNHT